MIGRIESLGKNMKRFMRRTMCEKRWKEREKSVKVKVSHFNVTHRYKSSAQVSKVYRSKTSIDVYDGRTELDSHADTFVAGRNCLLMHYTERVCDVVPYSDEYEAKKGIPVVKIATGYTNIIGQRFVLIVHEALWIPELQNSLMNPNQLREYGITVQDNPYAGEPMMIQANDDDGSFVACFKSEGTTIYFDTWTPTHHDLNECRQIVLTSPREWNPSTVLFPGMSDSCREEIESQNIGVKVLSMSKSKIDRVEHIDPYLEPMQIYSLHKVNAKIMRMKSYEANLAEGPMTRDNLKEARTFLSSQRHSNTTPQDLSEVWGISLEQARMTLEATTQHHVRSAIMPLSRRYRVDRMYEPKRLRCNMGTDTMDPHCEGLHGDRQCQVFGNKEMFTAAYPTSSGKASDIDEALKRFLQDYGAPETLTMDGSKAQTSRGSAFASRVRKNGTIPIICNPYRPNMNPCETVIRELRKR